MSIHTFIKSLSFLEIKKDKQIIKDKFKKELIQNPTKKEKPIKEKIPKRKALKEKNIKKKVSKQISSIIGSLLNPKEKNISVKPKVKKNNNKEIIKQLSLELKTLNLDKVEIQNYVYKYLTYRDRILLKKKEFTIPIIDYVNLLQNSICTYCGNKANSLDRINSKIGYTIENCVPCCKLCNTMKWDLSIQDFYSHIDKIHNYKLKPL